jgi:hypothetical protein
MVVEMVVVMVVVVVVVVVVGFPRRSCVQNDKFMTFDTSAWNGRF